MTEPTAACSLEVGQLLIPVAHSGPDNPLPMVGQPLETPYIITPPIPEEIIAGSRYGNPRNLYPYQSQDDYTRERPVRTLRTVTLENEFLRAVFLPELGGRLWDLLDKETGKHLLYTPPAIQFANLALRNAWFAGGIEWNIGTRGHSPTTCSPLHAAVVETHDGQSILRMWEFERLREVPFTIDAWLPAGSRLLFVAIRVTNPSADAVPMYWWTNAAVTETAATRVVAPASSAFRTDYTQGISRATPTDDGGIDCTWPSRNPMARDYFFDIPPSTPPWIMSVDEDGDGLVMASTGPLRGRKLFTWGRGPGGDRWQEWLSPEGGRYFEIQAGLAQTQFQHLLLAGRSEFSWVEAFGNASAAPQIAHGADWDAAVHHGQSRLASLLGTRTLDAVHATMTAWAEEPPVTRITNGSGWGALESVRRTSRGEAPLGGSGAPFHPESLTAQQQPWIDLIETGTFRGAETYVAGEDWAALLRAAPATDQSLLHLAITEHAEGRVREAETLYRRSLELRDSAGAHRGLALVAVHDDDVEEAAQQYELACSLSPDASALLIEAAAALLDHGLPAKALDLLNSATVPAGNGRLAFLRARALADVGDVAAAASILSSGLEVADLREGENSMHSLWERIHPGVRVPERYQFDMRQTSALPETGHQTAQLQ